MRGSSSESASNCSGGMPGIYHRYGRLIAAARFDPALLDWLASHTRRVDGRLLIGIALGVLGTWVALVTILWLLRPKDVALRELLGVVPDLVRLIRDLLADRQTPFGVRLALTVLLAWIVNPIDLIPEFIPVIGPLDDVVVAVLVLRYVRRRIGLTDLRARWPGTDAGFALLVSVVGST